MNWKVRDMLAAVLARPSVMNNMTDDEVIAVASVAANTKIEKFFETQICAAEVEVSKSALAQLALMNRAA